jgi:hypothetical protein
MADKKEPLSGVLNLRIDDGLTAEIDRIARLRGESASEVARRLLGYGAEVERRLQAQRLMQNYDREFADDVAGRVVISAEFVPYTWREAAEIQDELAAGGEYPARLPRWEDLTP